MQKYPAFCRLSGFLLSLSVLLVFLPSNVHQLQAAAQTNATWHGRNVCAGTGIGVISALVGAGGGFISVPFMVWCNVKMHNAVGTSAALGFPIAAAGTLGYIITGWSEPGLPQFPMMLGYIHLPALLSVAAASIFMPPSAPRSDHSIPIQTLNAHFAACFWFLLVYAHPCH